MLDPKLLTMDHVREHLKTEGVLIVNRDTDKDLDQFSKIASKVARVDATQISVDLDLTVAGLYVTNTIMLGALSKVMGFPDIESIESAIKEHWPDGIGEKNAKGAREGYNNIKIVYEGK